MTPQFIYAAIVLRIVDGDTMDLLIDQGLRNFSKQRVRLFGIDTPERGEPGWADATGRLTELAPVGTAVVVQSHHPRAALKADSFGRWLVEVYVGDQSVNDVLLSEGFAVSWVRKHGS